MTLLVITSHDDGDGVRRLVVAGELDSGNATELTDAIDQALPSRPPTALLIDVGAVTFCDSAGIRSLLIARRLAGERGIGCRVINVHGGVQRVLTLTGLLDLLTRDGQ